MQKQKVISRETVAGGNFINLNIVTFRDHMGRVRRWEAAGRVNAHGAVMVIARIMPDDALVLVRQFRPPAGKYMIEFPAGLMDKAGETIEDTAQRELEEETGYRGRLLKILPAGYSSPGLSGEAIATAVMEIDGEYFRQNPPQAHPEDSECIECFAVKRAELADFVNESIARGDGVDSKIIVYADAMKEIYG